jgi:crossover junction endodeoxyribonuclease RuvC
LIFSRSGESIRILGIDPGLRITGFGIIDKTGSQLTYVGSGCVTTTGSELPCRLKSILEGLNEIILQHHPEQVAIEHVFVNINPKSTLLLGQARGAAICAAVQKELTVFEYTALQIKQAVVGNGHARKEQVQEMVMRLLKLTERPRSDAADALACAICHAHTGADILSATGYRLRRGRRL